MSNKHSEPVDLTQRPTVRIKPSNYQPSKAELEEDMSIETTPEELCRVALQPVNIRYKRGK